MSEYSNEALGQMVSNTFGNGVLDSVTAEGNLVVKQGDSYTQVRAKDVKTMMIRSQIKSSQPELSQEVKDDIRTQKWGKRDTSDPKPTLQERVAADNAKHREFVAKKYGVK